MYLYYLLFGDAFIWRPHCKSRAFRTILGVNFRIPRSVLRIERYTFVFSVFGSSYIIPFQKKNPKWKILFYHGEIWFWKYLLKIFFPKGFFKKSKFQKTIQEHFFKIKFLRDKIIFFISDFFSGKIHINSIQIAQKRGLRSL